MGRLTIAVEDLEGTPQEDADVTIRLETGKLHGCTQSGGQIQRHTVAPVDVTKQTNADGEVTFQLAPSSNFHPETDYEVEIEVELDDGTKVRSSRSFRMPNADTTLSQILAGEYDDDAEPAAADRPDTRSELLELADQSSVAEGSTVTIGIDAGETVDIEFPTGQVTPTIITDVDADADRFTVEAGLYIVEVHGEAMSGTDSGRGEFELRDEFGILSLDHPFSITVTVADVWVDFSRSLPVFVTDQDVARLAFTAISGPIELRNVTLRLVRWG